MSLLCVYCFGCGCYLSLFRKLLKTDMTDRSHWPMRKDKQVHRGSAFQGLWATLTLSPIQNYFYSLLAQGNH